MTSPMGHPEIRDPTEHARALEAERNRLGGRAQTIDELIGLLVRTIHDLYRTPPDEHQGASTA